MNQTAFGECTAGMKASADAAGLWVLTTDPPTVHHPLLHFFFSIGNSHLWLLFSKE